MKVIAHLKGGLGNQLFIYAAAKCFATEHDVPLYVDKKSGFWGDKYKRHYQLNELHVQSKSLSCFSSIALKVIMILRSRLKISFPSWTFLSDSNWYSHKNITISGTIVFDDYFQNEVYFNTCKDKLKNELTQAGSKALQNTSLPGDKNLVCVHGRLKRAYDSEGNLVSALDPKTLPKEYFQTALKKLQVKRQNLRFVLFSDSPELFARLLNLEEGTYILGSELKLDDIGEFYLMQQCKDYVISNSSYSWWAAWLGSSVDSNVYVPPVQFWDNESTVPKRWTIINYQ